MLLNVSDRLSWKSHHFSWISGEFAVFDIQFDNTENKQFDIEAVYDTAWAVLSVCQVTP